MTDHTVDLTRVDAILDKYGKDKSSIVSVLHAVSEEYSWLPGEALLRISEISRIGISHIISVASFYPQFRFSPAGKHRIKVCIGTACHVKGAQTVFNAVKQFLSIPEDCDTDPDRLFTVARVACLGCCMLAPAVQIDNRTYGYLTRENVPRMIDDFLRAKVEDQKAAATATQSNSVSGKLDVAAAASARFAHLRMCNCSSCEAAGAVKVYDSLAAEIRRRKLPVTLGHVGCSGVSFQAPIVEAVVDSGTAGQVINCSYGRVTEETSSLILDDILPPDNPIAKIAHTGNLFLQRVFFQSDTTTASMRLTLRTNGSSLFWGNQRHLVTEGAHENDPVDLEAYRKNNGFVALDICRKAPDKSAIIQMLLDSGLRGRGGAGYPTGKKWRQVFMEPAANKFVIANGDEGDPGAFMDRMLVESFPFRVIEGVACAMETTGAMAAYLYVRMEYPLALARLREALEKCMKAGILSHNGKTLSMTVVEGGGAFVCGEETALIASIEGRRGTPRTRPPFPAQRGLFDSPTLVNNVETFSLVPWIIKNGPGPFRAMGTETSPGTKTFALAGKIKRGGLVEVPMGITLREIVFDIGGGIQDDRAFKAIQIGGPSGGCIPSTCADIPVDYEELQAHGAMMGSGGLVVLDETDCMVEIARYFMAFTQAESCGQCTPCRVGTLRMLEILERLTSGRGTMNDINELERLSKSVSSLSLCGLGKTAPNPVLSTLKYFREEYILHTQGRCPALSCKALVSYRITDKCIGCTRCSQYCPVDAIPYTPFQKHVIDDSLCTRCDTCRLVCPSSAIEKTGHGERHG